jgi:CRP/FNR family transcriptional regulator
LRTFLHQGKKVHNVLMGLKTPFRLFFNKKKGQEEYLSPSFRHPFKKHKMLHDTPRLADKFAGVFEPELVEALEATGMVMEVNAGNTMLNIGQAIRAVPLVLSGTFKVSRLNDEGQEMLLYYVKEGESCAMTFNCCMTGQFSVIKGTAEENSVLLCVPLRVVDEWMTKYPSWKKFVMNTMFNRFIELVKAFDDVAFKKLDERLFQYLKAKANATGSMLLNVTHQQIADDLGTNRVVVSRLLKVLENNNKLLLYRNQVRLMKDR